MRVQDTKAMKAYFRNNPKFGRTTKLIVKATGEELFEGMGECTRTQLWRGYIDQQAKPEAGDVYQVEGAK